MWRLSAGDTVIFSSKIIPGNEKSVFKILNQLAMQGVNVITSKMADIHVSGHPCADELRQLYETICPEYAIPVHGEERHMQRHAQIAMECGVFGTEIPHNGDIIEIAPNFGWVSSVDAGRLYIDGYFLEDDFQGAPQERKRLGYAGCATIFINLNHNHQLIDQPHIATWGVPMISGEGFKETQELYKAIITEAFYELSSDVLDNDGDIEEEIRLSFRREVNRIWGKKPMTQVIVNRIKHVQSGHYKNKPAGNQSIKRKRRE
jgi:ribonuclease J